jgi:hypothetical protein
MGAGLTQRYVMLSGRMLTSSRFLLAGESCTGLSITAISGEASVTVVYNSGADGSLISWHQE